MKLASYETPTGQARITLVDVARGLALDLAIADDVLHKSIAPTLFSMQALIQSGDEGLAHVRRLEEQWPAEASLPLAAMKLLSPLPRPNSLRDCLVFKQHMINAQMRLAKLQNREPTPITPLWFERPTYYKGNRMSVIGTETDIHWPRYSEHLDFELELACVVGKKGKDIAVADGLSHIFGFMVFNDVSARDMQAKEKIFNQGPTKGKDFDTGNVLGPWIVTTDEIGDPQNLTMEARINGERWGGGNSSDMQHSFAAIISFISMEETIYPGDVIGSGTVGTGCGIELDRKIQPGDVIELEIEKIGVLKNRVVKKS